MHRQQPTLATPTASHPLPDTDQQQRGVYQISGAADNKDHLVVTDDGMYNTS